MDFDGFTRSVEEVSLRIRATRGQSTERQRDRETERQRDRESRPNPLKDQGDSSKALRPGDFGRFVGNFHSVAKQAPSGIDLRSVFRGFRSDFRKFWDAKTEVKIDIGDVFFRCFFGSCFGIDFGWIFGGSDLEKSMKTTVFSMVFVNFPKINVFKNKAKKR